jgi:hypothetical protein
MASAVRALLLGTGLALLTMGAATAAAGGCQGEAPEDGDAQCLLQGGLRSTKEVRAHEAKDDVVCFSADLETDPSAVPVNSESKKSSGHALIKVNPWWVGSYVAWDIPGVNSTNPIIGVHIHKGDSATNGPILVGFCGQDPLPPFSGACQQVDEAGLSNHIQGKACDVTGSGSPCANTDGTATIEEAAQELMQSSDPSSSFYLNIHTMFSFEETDKMALGLIRGQLNKVPCDH